MKANLPQREPEMLKRWEDKNVFAKTRLGIVPRRWT